jgi:hypothetical protein
MMMMMMMISREMRWTWHVAHMGVMRNSYKVSVQNHEGKRLLGRRSQRWEDNIKMDIK